MKKTIFFLILIFLLVSANTSALENFTTNLNFGYLGAGFHSSDKQVGEIDLFNIGIEHENTNIGMEYSLIKFWWWKKPSGATESEIDRYSLFNLSIYWNALTLYSSSDKFKWFFGPFTKINYINVDGGNKDIKWNEYIYSAGLRIGFASLPAGKNKSNYNICRVEFGYRNINANHILYLNVSVDMGVLVYYAIVYAIENKMRENQANLVH